MRCTSLVVLTLGVLPLLAPPAYAQQRSGDTLFTAAKYLDFEQVADPQISPDGSQIVYTRRYVNQLEDRWEAALGRECGRLAEPIPDQGRQPALVAGRNAHRVHERR